VQDAWTSTGIDSTSSSTSSSKSSSSKAVSGTAHILQVNLSAFKIARFSSSACANTSKLVALQVN